MFTIDYEPKPERPHDRRQHPRLIVQRPAKVFNPQTGKYHAGHTCDLSSGGVLIELNHSMTARPGDVVLMGVAEKRRQPLLRHEEMIRVNIVRTMQADDGRMLLAVQFSPAAAPALDQSRKAA